MYNKEHIAATNHLCQINDPGSPGNTLVGNYCHFYEEVWNRKCITVNCFRGGPDNTTKL